MNVSTKERELTKNHFSRFTSLVFMPFSFILDPIPFTSIQFNPSNKPSLQLKDNKI